MKISVRQLRGLVREAVAEAAASKLKDVDPSTLRRAGARTYGHTDIGVQYAPEGLTEDESVAALRKQFMGAPMWKFEINRDPKNGRVYAYYEMDTSS